MRMPLLDDWFQRLPRPTQQSFDDIDELSASKQLDYEDYSKPLHTQSSITSSDLGATRLNMTTDDDRAFQPQSRQLMMA
jgi:hypothetical protein